MKLYFTLSISALLLSACGTGPLDPQQGFMDNLSKLCGQSFAGKVISDDPQDADWARETLIMHVRDCTAHEIRIPLHVGENRSRTWIIRSENNGLVLKHDHRHKDGEPDTVTQYGGMTTDPGTASEQAFPVDDFSKALFRAEGLDASVENVWRVIIEPGKTYTYALSRPNRDFRAEFDLTRPVETPPPAWGNENP